MTIKTKTAAKASAKSTPAPADKPKIQGGAAQALPVQTQTQQPAGAKAVSAMEQQMARRARIQKLQADCYLAKKGVEQAQDRLSDLEAELDQEIKNLAAVELAIIGGI